MRIIRKVFKNQRSTIQKVEYDNNTKKKQNPKNAHIFSSKNQKKVKR